MKLPILKFVIFLLLLILSGQNAFGQSSLWPFLSNQMQQDLFNAFNIVDITCAPESATSPCLFSFKPGPNGTYSYDFTRVNVHFSDGRIERYKLNDLLEHLWKEGIDLYKVLTFRTDQAGAFWTMKNGGIVQSSKCKYEPFFTPPKTELGWSTPRVAGRSIGAAAAPYQAVPEEFLGPYDPPKLGNCSQGSLLKRPTKLVTRQVSVASLQSNLPTQAGVVVGPATGTAPKANAELILPENWGTKGSGGSSGGKLRPNSPSGTGPPRAPSLGGGSNNLSRIAGVGGVALDAATTLATGLNCYAEAANHDAPNPKTEGAVCAYIEALCPLGNIQGVQKSFYDNPDMEFIGCGRYRHKQTGEIYDTTCSGYEKEGETFDIFLFKTFPKWLRHTVMF